jgi:hypothetical protein
MAPSNQPDRNDKFVQIKLNKFYNRREGGGWKAEGRGIAIDRDKNSNFFISK